MRILTVKHIRNYMLEITFRNKVVKRINLKQFLMSAKNPMTTKYRKVELFRQVKVVHGSLTWNGEMEFSGENLYRWEDNKIQQPSEILAVILSEYHGSSRCIILTIDYDKALTAAKKVIKSENKKYNKINLSFSEKKYFPNLKKEKIQEEGFHYGETVIDRWGNRNSWVEIVLFKIDKEYIPEWL